MKLNHSIKALVLTSAILFSFSVQANQSQPISSTVQLVTDSDSILEPPSMPAGVEVQDLPRSAESTKRYSSNCYAAYLIQKDGYRSNHHNNKLIYEVTVTNLGDCVLRDTTVVDFFPNRTRLENAWPHPKFKNEHKAVWERKWLSPGDTARYVLEFRVAPHTYNQWITNTACAWNSLIGQKICAWASVWWDRNDHTTQP